MSPLLLLLLLYLLLLLLKETEMGAVRVLLAWRRKIQINQRRWEERNRNGAPSPGSGEGAGHFSNRSRPTGAASAFQR